MRGNGSVCLRSLETLHLYIGHRSSWPLTLALRASRDDIRSTAGEAVHEEGSHSPFCLTKNPPQSPWLPRHLGLLPNPFPADGFGLIDGSSTLSNWWPATPMPVTWLLLCKCCPKGHGAGMLTVKGRSYRRALGCTVSYPTQPAAV